MTITLELNPDVEKELLAQAKARGVSLRDFVQDLVVREAHIAPTPVPLRTGKELVDICAKAQGLLTNDEVDTLFNRSQSFAQPVEFE